MKMLDLFSGIGGFSYAAHQFGIETVGFCEVDEFCSKVLKKHWPDVKNYGDIRNFRSTEHIDLITGGFPCQPFSVAGKKKGRDDDRYLWPEFLRVVKQTNPTWIVAENVPGIIDMELDNICDDLESEGYETRAFCIPACAVGAPHKRERLWIVAHSNREPSQQANPTPKPKQIEGDARMGLARQAGRNWNGCFTDTDSFQGDKRTEDIKPCTERQKRQINASEARADISQFNWEENQPPIPGVDDGLPNIVDRNKSLGNSIVPQIAFILIGLILQIETGVIYG